MARIDLRVGFVSRSRRIARSGIRPTYRNVLEIVRYVRMANTSHTRGLLGFGQMSRQLGYGIRKKNFQGRPRWRIGNKPAVMTAKTVMASDTR